MDQTPAVPQAADPQEPASTLKVGATYNANELVQHCRGDSFQYPVLS